MVEPLLPGTLIQGGVGDDKILELHQAYSSAFCHGLITVHTGGCSYDGNSSAIE